MATVDFGRYDQLVLQEFCAKLKTLQATPDDDELMSVEELVAKKYAVPRLLHSTNPQAGEPASHILDETMELLVLMGKRAADRHCTIIVQERSSQGPPADSTEPQPVLASRSGQTSALGRWAEDLASWVLHQRVALVPYNERVEAGLSVISKSAPTWAYYVRRKWCREGVALLSQVFSRTSHINELNARQWRARDLLGIPELDRHAYELVVGRYGFALVAPYGNDSYIRAVRALGRLWWEQAQAARQPGKPLQRGLLTPSRKWDCPPNQVTWHNHAAVEDPVAGSLVDITVSIENSYDPSTHILASDTIVLELPSGEITQWGVVSSQRSDAGDTGWRCQITPAPPRQRRRRTQRP